MDNISLEESFGEASASEWFDEPAYLTLNADVADAVSVGLFNSGYDHYLQHGREEGRLAPRLKTTEQMTNHSFIRNQINSSENIQLNPKGSLEVLMISPKGGLFLVGWMDDRISIVDYIEITGSEWQCRIEGEKIARFRRPDVEKALAVNINHSFGFFAFIYLDELINNFSTYSVSIVFKIGSNITKILIAEERTESSLRDEVLTYIAKLEVFGNKAIESIGLLEKTVSQALVEHNIVISDSFTNGAYVEKFGPRNRKLSCSIVVCLYGKSEFLFLQNSLFSGTIGFENYEIIYVSNSPEIDEKLLKDIKISTLIYEIPQTLVLLPGNAGFGAANNAAVNVAETNRIIILNPDVFPQDPMWAQKHSNIVDYLPKNQTEIFGAPLYYDDGSLMHGGMYFELDTGIVVRETEVARVDLIRVEHYGKGSPSWSERFTYSRPVPAVTGAFISVNRSWFEKIGGFTKDYIFGHYEDADLCLKSLSCGVAPWMHDIRMWHLEGKGSTRRLVHEGGSYVNRSLFSKRWKTYLLKGLLGPNPEGIDC